MKGLVEFKIVTMITMSHEKTSTDAIFRNKISKLHRIISVSVVDLNSIYIILKNKIYVVSFKLRELKRALLFLIPLNYFTRKNCNIVQIMAHILM